MSFLDAKALITKINTLSHKSFVTILPRSQSSKHSAAEAPPAIRFSLLLTINEILLVVYLIEARLNECWINEHHYKLKHKQESPNV